MVYKIGLVSTHGTGKSALAALVEGELKRRSLSTRVLREVATGASKIGLSINEATTKPAQLWILHQQFAQEIEHSQNGSNNPNYDVIICDRGPDNYCYLEKHHGEDQYALHMTLGHMELFPYSRLYLIPIVSDEIYVGEGVRSIDKGFQTEMDRVIREFLNKHQIPHTELPIPEDHDTWRDQWVKIVVNQTLKDLEKPEELYMK